MPLQSAGILLYRHSPEGLQVLLVHPGGPYNAKKDLGVWSVPKGLLAADEDGLSAAKREFEEETGAPLTATNFIPLNPIKQKSGKIVLAWAAEGDLDVTTIRSNVIRVEYPYKSGRWIDVPEVDRAAWFKLEEAARKIIPGQQPLLEELIAFLALQQ